MIYNTGDLTESTGRSSLSEESGEKKVTKPPKIILPILKEDHTRRKVMVAKVYSRRQEDAEHRPKCNDSRQKIIHENRDVAETREKFHLGVKRSRSS